MIGGRPAVIKSAKARRYVRDAQLQVRKLDRLLEGPLRATIDIWYASNRPDLDESVILDLLQGRVYVNDRQVIERHVRKHIDRGNPRAEILVEQLTAQQMSL